MFDAGKAATAIIPPGCAALIVNVEDVGDHCLKIPEMEDDEEVPDVVLAMTELFLQLTRDGVDGLVAALLERPDD